MTLIERLRSAHPDWYGDVPTLYSAAAARLEAAEKLIETLTNLATSDLQEICDIAMKNTIAARIPECGDFGAIAQQLSYVIQEALVAAKQWKDGV